MHASLEICDLRPLPMEQLLGALEVVVLQRRPLLDHELEGRVLEALHDVRQLLPGDGPRGLRRLLGYNVSHLRGAAAPTADVQFRGAAAPADRWATAATGRRSLAGLRALGDRLAAAGGGGRPVHDVVRLPRLLGLLLVLGARLVLQSTTAAEKVLDALVKRGKHLVTRRSAIDDSQAGQVRERAEVSEQMFHLFLADVEPMHPASQRAHGVPQCIDRL
mmetsp:Transcript_20040/g.58196  ORF Transcript_20040/g.58196 Transcript_20040/m.58196 type:complete len:219 (-) Transcript_20040:2996-3652(-)